MLYMHVQLNSSGGLFALRILMVFNNLVIGNSILAGSSLVGVEFFLAGVYSI